MNRPRKPGRHATTVYLTEDQHINLRAITRSLQDKEIPSCSQSDLIRTALDQFIRRWPKSRKIVVKAILDQDHYKNRRA